MHSEGGLVLQLAPGSGLTLIGTLEAAEQLNATEAPPTLPPAAQGAPDDVNITRIKEFYDIDHLDWGQVRATLAS